MLIENYDYDENETKSLIYSLHSSACILARPKQHLGIG